nr:MAG TPA: Major capsid protein [Caudoviricetes sp.]
MATYPMQTNTNSGVTVPKFWAKEILQNRRNRLVMEQLANHDYEGEVKNAGDTVHIISLPDMVAQDIVPGQEMTVTPLNPTEQLLLIDKYVGAPAEIQDRLMKQSTYELRRPFTERIGYALADAIDKHLITLATNDALAANKLAEVTKLSKAAIIEAHKVLDMANVPTEGRALVVNGVGVADLRSDAEMTWASQQGDGNISGAGYAGTIYNTPVYVTNQVQKTNTNKDWGFLLIHKSALTCAVQIDTEVESQRRALAKSTIIVGSTLWGGKVVRPDHIAVINRKV